MLGSSISLDIESTGIPANASEEKLISSSSLPKKFASVLPKQKRKIYFLVPCTAVDG